jgi:hypothetical protein
MQRLNALSDSAEWYSSYVVAGITQNGQTRGCHVMGKGR